MYFFIFYFCNKNLLELSYLNLKFQAFLTQIHKYYQAQNEQNYNSSNIERIEIITCPQNA